MIAALENEPIESENQKSRIQQFPSIDENDDEPELTSLAWLTELRNQNLAWTSINAEEETDRPKSQTNFSDAILKGKTRKAVKLKNVNGESGESKNLIHSQNQSTTKRSTPAERYKIFLDKIKRDANKYEQAAVNYQTNSSEKPPFNYSHIIGMAMLEKGRVTLQQICSWIEAKFAFFRVRKKWNNSIRHNLSLHHCFRKINRNKYEKGKGGYWELGIDPKKCDRKRIRNRKSSKSKLKLLSANKIYTDDIEHQCHETEAQGVTISSDQQEALFEYGEYSLCPPLEEGQQLNKLYVTEAHEFPQYHLGTIIISTASAEDSALNYFEPQQFQLNNMTYDHGERTLYSDMANMEQSLGQQRANVVVEQVSTNASLLTKRLECGSTLHSTMPLPIEQIVPATNAVVTVPISSTPNAIAESNSAYFTPYIDGIEEAFQYLRSMDQSNREDILDNILDISVSDY